jgi:hypothetical protein
MKKVISFVIATILSVTLFSQESLFTRAYSFTPGFKESKDSKVFWSNQFTSVDILISTTSEKVTIYSSEVQEYRILSLSEEIEGGSKWFAVDKDGKQCFYYIGYTEDYIFQAIEYSDYAWMYLVKVDE